MHYYIDGYNLMFRMLYAGDDLQAKREQIIRELSEKVQLLGLDATLVFDSYYQPEESTRGHFQALEVCFTNYGETADEFILQALKVSEYPQQQIVVTSDKKLAMQARRRLAQTLSVEEFMSWLGKRYKNKLNQKKELKAAKKAEKALSPKIAPKKAEPPSTLSPLPKTSPEECFDFYLTQFEASLKECEAHALAPKPKKRTPKIKKKKIPKHEKSDSISDMERWLKIFENRE